MSQNLGSLPPLSHNVTLRRPPPPPLTCDVIYGCPLTEIFPSVQETWHLKVLSLAPFFLRSRVLMCQGNSYHSALSLPRARGGLWSWEFRSRCDNTERGGYGNVLCNWHIKGYLKSKLWISLIPLRNFERVVPLHTRRGRKIMRLATLQAIWQHRILSSRTNSQPRFL